MYFFFFLNPLIILNIIYFHRYFDETDRSFTLGVIIQMKMQKHGEQISEISNKATMELNIENVNDLSNLT